MPIVDTLYGYQESELNHMINQYLVKAELTHLIADTFLLKVEAEDRLLLA